MWIRHASLCLLAAATSLPLATAAEDSTAATPLPVSRAHPRDLLQLQKRQNCGAGIGSCPSGQCCSQWGWCGTSSEHCGANCQPNFGTCSGGGNPGNPGNPGGGGTLNVPRPKFGSVPYGVNIASCSTPGTIALTFDDGPFIYTAELLTILARFNAKATFFINGNNWGNTRSAPYPDVLRRMINEGHQIGSHTNTHPNLDTLDSNGRRQQMAEVEAIMREIFGFFPTYMRPPYGACGGACQADMNTLGYHIIGWNIDTLDYANNSPGGIQTSVNIFNNAVSTNPSNAYISLAHDVHQYSVQILAEATIRTAQSRGYRLVTVGECLGDPAGNWYRDGTTGNARGGGGTTNPGPGPGNPSGPTVSPDATCGSNSGGRYTCSGSPFGSCCSQWGWCGSGPDYCGNGCQSGFGTC